MEIKELHRGRLIDHIGLVVRDLAASKAFYCAVFGVLKIPMGGSDERNFWADELFVSTPDSEAVQGEPGCIGAWRKDNGAPGERPYRPGYYAAFVLDPDGNNIEAVFHGEADRSAASVRIAF